MGVQDGRESSDARTQGAWCAPHTSDRGRRSAKAIDRPALIGVLALQGDFAAHGRMLEKLGPTHARVREVRVPADLDGLEGLVIPGGESTTMTLGIAREGLAEPLREIVHAGLSV